MVKPLTFKGDKKPKKRKHHEVSNDAPVSNSSTADAGSDDSWTSPAETSDLAGPTVLVLPTRPPTCLAADALGNVFASPLENMVENDPRTAEPHDVRQVWIATHVPGMGKDEYSFKGSHGGYLSCDQYGILGAKREARGREEGFILDFAENEDGQRRWQLRTAASKGSGHEEERRYLSAATDKPAQPTDNRRDATNEDVDAGSQKVSVSLRGDGDSQSDNTYVILRMQSKFLPQTEMTKEANRSREKVSRRELEAAAGRTLTDDEVKRLKRAKRDGTYHEEILDLRAKEKHDKFA